MTDLNGPDGELIRGYLSEYPCLIAWGVMRNLPASEVVDRIHMAVATKAPMDVVSRRRPGEWVRYHELTPTGKTMLIRTLQTMGASEDLIREVYLMGAGPLEGERVPVAAGGGGSTTVPVRRDDPPAGKGEFDLPYERYTPSEGTPEHRRWSFYRWLRERYLINEHRVYQRAGGPG